MLKGCICSMASSANEIAMFSLCRFNNAVKPLTETKETELCSRLQHLQRAGGTQQDGEACLQCPRCRWKGIGQDRIIEVFGDEISKAEAGGDNGLARALPLVKCGKEIETGSVGLEKYVGGYRWGDH